MSLLSSIGKWFKAVFKKILNFVKKFLKKFWWIILIIAIIYFAPYLLAYLTSIGAPEFITTAFSFISTSITPTVTSALTWLWEGATSFGSAAWTAYKDLGFGTQLAIAGGAAALIAPEETMEVIEEATKTAGQMLGAVASGVASGLGSTSFGKMLILGAVGVGAWFLFGRDDKQEPRPAT